MCVLLYLTYRSFYPTELLQHCDTKYHALFSLYNPNHNNSTHNLATGTYKFFSKSVKFFSVVLQSILHLWFYTGLHILNFQFQLLQLVHVDPIMQYKGRSERERKGEGKEERRKGGRERERGTEGERKGGRARENLFLITC